MAQRKPVHRGSKSEFVREDGGTSGKRKLANGKRTYATLRGVAMRLIDHLELSLPRLKKKDLKGAVKSQQAGKTQAAAKNDQTAPKQDDPEELVTWTPADYERLLGRNGGVIDSFKTLTELIVRLFEVEEARCAPTNSDFEFTELDEDELDRRITTELDRLAERRRSAKAA